MRGAQAFIALWCAINISTISKKNIPQNCTLIACALLREDVKCNSTFLNAWVASVLQIPRVTSKLFTHALLHLHVVIVLSVRAWESMKGWGVEAGVFVQGSYKTKESTGRLILILLYFTLHWCKDANKIWQKWNVNQISACDSLLHA